MQPIPRDKRREGLAGGGRQRQLARPCQAPPIVDLLGAAPMPLRELRNHRGRREALNNNAGLLFIWPAATPLAARVKLDAPRGNQLWAVSSVVRMVHCPLHGTVRNRSARTPLRVSEGPCSTAYAYHSTPADAAEVAARAGAKKLVLTHVTPLPNAFIRFKYLRGASEAFDGPIVIAEDGMLFDF
jgi:hypothetical protein